MSDPALTRRPARGGRCVRHSVQKVLSRHRGGRAGADRAQAKGRNALTVVIAVPDLSANPSTVHLSNRDMEGNCWISEMPRCFPPPSQPIRVRVAHPLHFIDLKCLIRVDNRPYQGPTSASDYRSLTATAI